MPFETLRSTYYPYIDVLLCILLVVALPMPILIFAHRRQTRVIKKIANHLQGTVSVFSLYPSIIGKFEKFETHITWIQPRNPGRFGLLPGYLKISLVKNSLLKFTVHKKAPFAYFVGKLGVSRRVETHDETLDKEFLVFSNDPIRAGAYLINVKNTLKELFDMGFSAILVDGRRVTAEKKDQCLDLDMERDLSVQRVEDVLQKLSFLATRLP